MPFVQFSRIVQVVILPEARFTRGRRSTASGQNDLPLSHLQFIDAVLIYISEALSLRIVLVRMYVCASLHTSSISPYVHK